MQQKKPANVMLPLGPEHAALAEELGNHIGLLSCWRRELLGHYGAQISSAKAGSIRQATGQLRHVLGRGYEADFLRAAELVAAEAGESQVHSSRADIAIEMMAGWGFSDRAAALSEHRAALEGVISARRRGKGRPKAGDAKGAAEELHVKLCRAIGMDSKAPSTLKSERIRKHGDRKDPSRPYRRLDHGSASLKQSKR